MSEFSAQTCPHCLGATCIHCREKRQEAASRPRRSKLTPDERRALELMPLRGYLRFDLPASPEPPKCFGLCVLPLDLPAVLTGLEGRTVTIKRPCH